MTRDGFQLPLNITGALSCSQEEDHFADSPGIIVTLTSDKVRNWGQNEKGLSRTLIKTLTMMTRVSFIEK